MPRYALTDLHGCPKTFLTMLAKIGLTREDDLFLLGDYVDRGPDSEGMLTAIWDLENQGYRVTSLMGNHEAMWLNDLYLEMARGNSLGPIRSQALEWMYRLPRYAETPGYLLVHAGLNFRHPNPLHDQESMIWIRNWYESLDKDWLGDRVLVHGHTPEPLQSVQYGIEHIQRDQRVCIDSGCAFTLPGMGYLTALNLDTQEGIYLKRVD
ncbi:metallophosphoesterase family protein [Neolewinella lacunae]|uniref:Serine/threonine protein phosphatase n=1 Tax=Neolewinella lacunae TaxID=1517758 RepID=A0A923PL36_9BACT|nr:metallophosphoesterase family protein [Neolewinella lacunae]MBC6995354.1 serine/threonine protein phosphatase [Neolewinella lacunae]MDN3633066.1 metallophosphoesterase family protein [Neolewinella lacunae]